MSSRERSTDPITADHRLPEELHLDRVFTVTPVAMLIVDAAGTIVARNHAADVLLEGVRACDNIHALLTGPDETADLATTVFADVSEITQDSNLFEASITNDIGERRFAQVSSRRISDALHLYTLINITGRKEMERRLRYEALHDRMTGLPNRNLFLDRIGQALLREEEATVVVIGVDKLKRVNETMGHTVGDQVLVELSGRLSSLMFRGSTVARIGGDEFAVLSIEPWDETMLELLRAGVSSKFALQPNDGRELILTASFGVRHLRGSLEIPEVVLADAELALERAKELGRNCVSYFESGMRDRAAREAALARALREAIARAEIEVDYQPIHSAVDGRLCGFEALARWRKGALGHVSPAEFIPVAEARGLIRPIGAFVLRSALAQLCLWRKTLTQASDIFMSVNLSAAQVRDAEHLEELKSILRGAGVPLDLIKLEVTESVFIDMSSDVASKLIELKDLGVQLFLDDFGTGYASLYQLQGLPFDGIKVDRSFVQRAEIDKKGLNLVRTMVQMARGLELRCVAEGVETEAQRDILREAGVDYFQGYLFGRPTTPDAVNWDRA